MPRDDDGLKDSGRKMEPETPFMEIADNGPGKVADEEMSYK